MCAASRRHRDNDPAGRFAVTGRAAIQSCSLVLAHAPDLVRHGSKPTRELAADSDGLLSSLTQGLRSYEDALALRAAPGPDRKPAAGSALGRRASLVGESGRGAAAGTVRRRRRPGRAVSPPAGGRLVRSLPSRRERSPQRRAHDPRGRGSRRIDGRGPRPGREPLGVGPPREPRLQGDRRARARAPAPATGLDPVDVPYVIGSGEEAVGDRYQRGGGNLAKAIAEAGGLRRGVR